MTSDDLTYHSVHANDANREAHGLFDRRVDERQLVQSGFGPFAAVGFEHCFTLFAEFGNEGFCVWGVEEVEEGVGYGLVGMLGELAR